MVLKEILFKELFQLRRALEYFELKPEESEEIIKHEKSHFEEAIRLGYTPMYGIKIGCDKNNGIYLKSCFVRTKEERTNEDSILILTAPKRLSSGDLEALSELNLRKLRKC